MTVGLSVGTHIVTLRAYDDEGASGQAFVSVDIVGPPSVTITAPTDGHHFLAADLITFEGTASDPDGGEIDSLVWTSNVDGRLGAGSPLMVNLSPGTHTITLTAYDDEGASSSTSISVTATAPPSVVITAPADSSRSLEGVDVTFTADAQFTFFGRRGCDVHCRCK
jgi:hypothetical protein